MSSSAVLVVQWMIDTRVLWPVDETRPAKEQVQELRRAASTALGLLTTEERTAVLKYFHVKDAKMSLASALLKRCAVAVFCDVPWSACTLSRSLNGKPCYVSSAPHGKAVEFNVSHQAGIVALVACAGSQVDLGTDVVCVNERNDHAYIEREGFVAWVDAHADVFAPAEVQAMKFGADYLALPTRVDLPGPGRDAVSRCQHRHRRLEWRDAAGELQVLESNVVIDAKLRRFYAHWCLREAYVKMTGEALLADWLRQLEFRHVRAPAAAGEAIDNATLRAGETISEFNIYFEGSKVLDVRMELKAFGRDYMVGSAARPRRAGSSVSDVSFVAYTELDFERDVASHAVG